MLRTLTGYKLLLSLLRRTPEWLSPDARVLAARACGASGDKELARILRSLADSAGLSKSHLLCLTRLWGYRTDIWCQQLKMGLNLVPKAIMGLSMRGFSMHSAANTSGEVMYDVKADGVRSPAFALHGTALMHPSCARAHPCLLNAGRRRLRHGQGRPPQGHCATGRLRA